MYKEKKKNNFMIEALAFWELIRGERIVKKASNAHEWSVRKKNLAKYLKSNNNNYFIKIIATVESLPTSIFRKLLRKGNIDFVSFKSFLNRLNGKQEGMIKSAYEDLPIKLRGVSFWDRIKGVLGIKSSIEFKEGWDTEKRYSSHHSMACNILGLGFGFCAFKDDVSDIKATKFDPRIFFTTGKAIVIDEKGIYQWLFKFVRIWKPDYVVKAEMRKHFCLGFWFTMIVCFLLFAVSLPSCFLMLLQWPIHLTAKSIMIGLCGIFFPFWTVIVLWKCFIPEKIKEYCEEVLGWIVVVILITALTVMCIMVTLLAYKLFAFLFGKELSILYIFVLYVFMGHKYFFNELKCIKFLNDSLWWVLIAMCSLAIVRTVVVYLAEILEFFQRLFCWIAKMDPVSLLLIIPFIIAIMIFFIFPLYSEEKEEKICDRIKGWLKISTAICLVLSLGAFVYVIKINGECPMFLIIFLLLSLFFLLENSIVFNKSFRTKEAKRLCDHINFYGEGFLLLLNNNWFWTLNQTARREFLKQVDQFILGFDGYEFRKEIYIHLLPRITKDILVKMEQNQEDLYSLSFEDERLVFKIMSKLFKGMPYNKAEALSRIERVGEEKIKRVIISIFFPITFAWIVVKKVFQCVVDAWVFCMLLRKMCPSVIKEGVME